MAMMVVSALAHPGYLKMVLKPEIAVWAVLLMAKQSSYFALVDSQSRCAEGNQNYASCFQDRALGQHPSFRCAPKQLASTSTHHSLPDVPVVECLRFNHPEATETNQLRNPKATAL